MIRSCALSMVAIVLMAGLDIGCGGSLRTVSDDVSGQSIYDLHLRDIHGRTVEFSQYRNKVLVIDLFTTWAQPSVISMPGYSALYRKYRQQGLQVLGIGLDKLGAEVLLPFADGMQIDFPVLLADRNIQDGKSVLGEIKVIPTLLVFDRSGKLAWVFFGLVKEPKLAKIIEKLL